MSRKAFSMAPFDLHRAAREKASQLGPIKKAKALAFILIATDKELRAFIEDSGAHVPTRDIPHWGKK
jgi:hypothetical protein